MELPSDVVETLAAALARAIVKSIRVDEGHQLSATADDSLLPDASTASSAASSAMELA
jgi:hypothetical protein